MLSSALISLMMNASGVTLPPIDEKQVFCLAENVYFEARDQSQLGQYAVTHVVLNRVRSDKFPDDICSVIKQGKKQNGNMILKAGLEGRWGKLELVPYHLPFEF